MGTGTRTQSWLVGFSRDTVMATNGVLALASAGPEASSDAQTVAEETGRPVGEVCTVLRRLQDAGLVKPGRNGAAGFRLTRSPDRVSLYDIAAAVGEPFEFCCYLERGRAGSTECAACLLAHVCKQVREDVIGLLKARTVSDLLTAKA